MYFPRAPFFGMGAQAKELAKLELTGKVPTARVKQARQTLEEAMQRLDQTGGLVMMEQTD